MVGRIWFWFMLVAVYVPYIKCSGGHLVNLSDSGDNSSSHGNTSSHHGSHGIHIVVWNIHAVKEPLIFTVVVLLAFFSKLVFHHANYLSSIVPESCMLIVVGTILGAIFHFTQASDDLPPFFEPHQFFMFLLPPIILESAFSLHDRTFAENLGSVLLFAVVGTILACFMLGGTLYGLAQCGAMGAIQEITFVQMLVFTSLIVAVDPVAVLAVFQEIGVNHVLYFLVFGESLLNDGVTVVLYHVMQAYNLMDEITAEQILLGVVKFFVVCFGGLALGVIFGLLSAVLTRFSLQVKVVQPIIIYGMAYMGFMMAELFEFSGIISIIGCGLVQVQYAFHNISDKSRITIKYFTKVVSSLSEIIIFLFLGLAFVRQGLEWHTGFILWTVLLCLVFRFIITFGMSLFINKFDNYRVRKIGLDEQFMIAYGGLRGAVCFSLVALLNPKDIPMKNLFETATLSVIVFTGFVQGISIKPLVNLLQIRLAPQKNLSMYQELNQHITDHMMAGIEDVIGFHGKYYLKEKIEHIDDKYLKRYFVQKPMKKSDSSMINFYEKIMLKEHIKYLNLCGAKSVPIVSIPKIDTQLYLNQDECSSDSASDSDEDKTSLKHISRQLSTHGDDDGIVMRKAKTDKGQDIDAHGLRSLLQSMHASRTLRHSQFDKNLISDPRHRRSHLLHDKTRMNRNLQRVMSQTYDKELKRATSWDEDQADVCDKRTKGNHNDKQTPRSISVDLSKMSTPKVHFEPQNKLPSVNEIPDQMASNGQTSETQETEEKTALLESPSSESNETRQRHTLMERQDAVDEIPLVVIKK